MRPASIISMILAIVLVVAGMITCTVARNMALNQGEFIFSEVRNGDTLHTVEITDTDISQINITAENLTVNIIGGADKSYVEFINFRENYYSLSQTNRNLTFKEFSNVLSMLKFWENGFSFKGMRYILNFNNENGDEEREKTINIYLADEKEIKRFNISATKCTLNISNIKTATDYYVSAGDLTVNADSFETSSVFSINHAEDADPNAEFVPRGKVNVKFNKVNISKLIIDSQTLNFESSVFDYKDSVTMRSESGLINIGFARYTYYYSCDLTSDLGTITVESALVASPYTQSGTDRETGLFKIISENADINVTYKSEK